MKIGLKTLTNIKWQPKHFVEAGWKEIYINYQDILRHVLLFSPLYLQSKYNCKLEQNSYQSNEEIFQSYGVSEKDCHNDNTCTHDNRYTTVIKWINVYHASVLYLRRQWSLSSHMFSIIAYIYTHVYMSTSTATLALPLWYSYLYHLKVIHMRFRVLVKIVKNVIIGKKRNYDDLVCDCQNTNLDETPTSITFEVG